MNGWRRAACTCALPARGASLQIGAHTPQRHACTCTRAWPSLSVPAPATASRDLSKRRTRSRSVGRRRSQWYYFYTRTAKCEVRSTTRSRRRVRPATRFLSRSAVFFWDGLHPKRCACSCGCRPRPARKAKVDKRSNRDRRPRISFCFPHIRMSRS